MSIAASPLADASISDSASQSGGKKPPPKRTVAAVAERSLVPEPR